MKYPEEIYLERVKELEAENALLRNTIEDLLDELAYHGFYKRDT